MLKEALRFPEFTQITQLGSYTISYKSSDGTEVNTPLTATDHYLTGEATAPKGITVLGGKTGTTSDAGNCLALLSRMLMAILMFLLSWAHPLRSFFTSR